MMVEDQVMDIVDTWRATPSRSFQPEDYQQLKDLGLACLAEDESQQLLKFIQDQNNQGVVESMGWVLLGPLVNKVLTKEKSVDNCQRAVTHLTKICCPHELLQSFYQLIDDIDPGAISDTIVILLPHLQTVLYRLDEGRADAVGRILLGVQTQMSRLPVPFTSEQEDEDEHGLCRCCTALIIFITPLVGELKRRHAGTTPREEGLSTHREEGLNTPKEEELSTPKEEELNRELRNFCMRSLREPLLDAALDEGRASPLWIFSVEIMKVLHVVSESLSVLLLLRRPPLMDNSQAMKESLACGAYLLFVHLITIDRFPAVFSPEFVLQCNMEHVTQLLSSKKESHLLKGLALFTKSLENVQDQNLPLSLVGLKSFYSVSQNLTLLLTDCPVKHLRQSGLKLLQLLINKLNAEAKHKFFRCMFQSSNHAGIQSFIVKNIRTQVERSMKDWLLGDDFLFLFSLVLSLPQGVHTDLLHNMDTIMESLNLVRFVLIRDSELRSRAHVWEELCSVRDKYLHMLDICINMSRAYYTVQIKELKEDYKVKAKNARDVQRSNRVKNMKNIVVKPENVSNMSPEVQHQVFQCALVTFDLMESLVARIKEITEEKKSKQH
ncbi:glomulin-like [Gouania willdenowi]|uniref:glomulin-like n=1 Tax=Gouania willdenowi TaxID=441366 RepID=UPI0010543956|nr:glomulin-like [Gouania willdenowi]